MTEEGGGRFTRRGALAYSGAIEAVLAILIGVGLGYLVDRWLESAPAFMLVGLVAGFGSFILLIVRLTRKLAEAEEDGETTDGE